MTHGIARARMWTVARCLFVLVALTFLRVVQLVAIDRESLTAMARRQQVRELILPPERGAIVDRAGNALALTVESSSIFIDPVLARLSAGEVAALAGALHLDVTSVAHKAASTSRFHWLKRNATPEEADAVAALRLDGVVVQPSRSREYPRRSLAGQLIGFAGIDGEGLEGIEREYDKYLAGTAEKVLVERDAKGRYALGPGAWREGGRQGARVELTIDANIQRIVEDELGRAVAERRATAGYAVVMDPQTGEILALANVPLFDPNLVESSRPEVRKNGVIAFRYEPGSTFKTILAASAVETGVAWPDKRIFCENGHYSVGSRTIHDHDPYGMLTFTEVIKYSSNIGAAKVAEQLGVDRFAKSVESFGFGHPTGVDLPFEAGGSVRAASEWRKINLVTASYGHGLSVTPLQLARAYSAIANGGQLLRPYVVRRVVDAEGSVLLENRPKLVGVPVSARTSQVVTEMLREVVMGGTGTQASVDGVPVGGKTGTTKKLEPNGTYSRRDYISSFVGYFPTDHPRFLMLVIVDTPRTAIYGGVVAGPVFRAVGEYVADHYGLRPPEAPAPPPSAPSTNVQFVEWPPESGGMPSYIGLPLRAALAQAVRAGWEVSTKGSGFVVHQDPPPGAKTAKGRQLHLELGPTAG